MQILKFGGSSVANAERIEQLAKIIGRYKDQKQLVVVVSALQGVTNLLENSAKAALENSDQYTEFIDEIRRRHIEIINELVADEQKAAMTEFIKDRCSEANKICQSVKFLSECSDRTRAKLLSMGERMSSTLISATLNNLGLKNVLIDARNIIITDNCYLQGHVDHALSEQKTRNAFRNFEGIAVVPGFISSTCDSEPSTLGRGGSDYTAALLGNYLNASLIDIWTDVSGMLTAAPNIVSAAYPIKSMSYEEAMELSYFGAKVIYPPTIQPALEKKIPIGIKNSYAPDDEGTMITEHPNHGDATVKGFSSIGNISLVTVSGSGMIGVPGVAMRAFKALCAANVNVLFITQSSSEHTICVGIYTNDAEQACARLNEEFAIEIERKIVHTIESEDGLAIIAVVGDKMREQVGIAGKAFRLLGENGINIRAIAQGATERNISIVIKEKEVAKALNALHDGFFLSKYKRVHLFMVGVGTVGGTMLDQLRDQTDFLKNEYGIDIRVVGISNSKRMIFNRKGIDLTNWRDLLANA
ncbi:MAG: aspartate kinase, partial [Salinivirgaceae bacterium]|nr:aspartate kinase [Salinivirgaceae bacterium]